MKNQIIFPEERNIIPVSHLILNLSFLPYSTYEIYEFERTGAE